MKRKRWVSVLVLVGILVVVMMGFAVGAAEVAQEEVLTMEDVWAEIRAAEKEGRAAWFGGKTLECLELSNTEINTSLEFYYATILGNVRLENVKIKDSRGQGLTFSGATLKGNLILYNTEVRNLFAQKATIVGNVRLRDSIIKGCLSFAKAVVKGEICIESKSSVGLVYFTGIQVGEHIFVQNNVPLAIAIHLSQESNVVVPVADLRKFFFGLKASK